MIPERAIHILGDTAKTAKIGIRCVSNRDGGAWIVFLDNEHAIDANGYVRMECEFTRTTEPYTACHWRAKFERLVEAMSED